MVKVIHLSLERVSSFCSHIVKRLEKEADVTEITTISDAIKFFQTSNPEPSSRALGEKGLHAATDSTSAPGQLDPLSTQRPAILASDTTLKSPATEAQALRAAAIDYIRNGGTIVLALDFPSGSMSGTTDFFQDLSLPWAACSYYRTTFSINDQTGLNVSKLPKSYSVKAQHLFGVAEKDKVYIPTAQSKQESLSMIDDEMDMEVTAVAFAKVGKGYVGYIGDVNGEEETAEVVLAMLGVL